MPATEELWRFLVFGYLVTIVLETPVLLVGLSPAHSIKTRVAASLWLTACTYPIVDLVLPELMRSYSRTAFLIVAETFAPAAECALFYVAFCRKPFDTQRRPSLPRDFAAIIAANLVSFVPIELLRAFRLIDW